jgi:DNA-binding CsgD family transcriptional regulator
MEPIQCDRINEVLEEKLRPLGWDDYVYTFTLAKDWLEPGTAHVQALSSENMRHFLESYQQEGFKHVRLRVSGIRSDYPRLINLDDGSNLYADRKLIQLFKDHGWQSNMAWPTYGYGGALGFTVLFSEKHDMSPDVVNKTISTLAPWLMQFNAWSRALIEKLYLTKHLTQRELDCILLAAEGKTSRKIAEILSITKRTVDFHIHNATRKLGVSSRTQAVSRLAQISFMDVGKTVVTPQ